MTEAISVGRIARILGVERESLFSLGGRAEYLYRHTRTTKGRKHRILSEPAAELKDLQRQLAEKILLTLPVSPASFSVKGGGVIRSASHHVSDAHMLVLDLADCFPATGCRLVEEGLTRAGLTSEASRLVTQLVTVKGALPQGAPTSSIVLDIVLHDLDGELSSLAERYTAVYTRYADDLCFSGPVELSALAHRARRIVRRHGFAINERKTRLTGPGDQHIVTGIVVSDELNPRPGYTSQLSQKLKWAKRDPNARMAKKLRGQTEWVRSVNPAEGGRLRKQNAWLFERDPRETHQ